MRITDIRGLLQLICLFLSCYSAKLPKYQAIVYPEVFEERDDEGITVLKINEDITLNLKPSSVLHPEFFLRTYREGVPQHTYFNVDALEENLYDDEKRFAAVIMTEEDGALQLKGVVGPNLKILPAVGIERSEEGRIPHILETIHDTDSDHAYGKFPEEGVTKLSARYLPMEPTAYRIETVYPEVFVVVDQTFYREFKSRDDMLYYMMIEFRVVALRYKTVQNPKMIPIFRGIEISQYVQEGRYFTYIGAGIDGLKSLYAIVEYVKKNNHLYKDYDLVYFTTGRDMIAVEGSRQESALQGFAFVGSACTEKRQQLGEDKADSFIGIRIMAHEMGHTLGCSHDGTNVDGIIKGFKSDSLGCPWEHGHIMSYIEEDSRSYRFSSCCDYMMSLVSWSVEAGCLRKNETITNITKIHKTIYLPGQFLDRDRQCRMTYPTLRNTFYLKKFGARRCIAQCYVDGREFRASSSHWPMLLIDGSMCDEDNKWVCINGMCVENNLKRYKPRKSPKTKRPKEKPTTTEKKIEV
uniref:Reprolysin n=1 Tax=Rhipicephalus appendiculatus TaxID=34631 RepID=A0A131YFM5_RHIAP